MTRTYGRYRYVPAGAAARALTEDARGEASKTGYWALRCEPAISMRVRRHFVRLQTSRRGELYFAYTDETARDLHWFTSRYPLDPADSDAFDRLIDGSARHQAREVAIADILTGKHTPLPGTRKPTVEPRDYQIAANNLLRISGGLLLTDELGLGKTLTGALTFLDDDALPGLVVAPAHLASPKGGRWVEELDEHFPFLRYHVLRSTQPYDLADSDGNWPDVVICSYSKLQGWADHLAGRIRSVVFDEVQDLRRGQDSYKGQAAAQIAYGTRLRLGLTATPVYNYAGEAFNLMDVLAPGTLGQRDEFVREWGAASWGSHVQVADPHALGSYLREQGVMLGRTRADVGRELPKTIKVVETVETDPAAIEAVQGDAAAMARLILDAHSDRKERFQAAGELDMIMRQATGVAKAPYVAEFCRLLLESEEKIVLFGWHRAVYDIWAERLAGYNPVQYSGSESPTQKADAIKAFKGDESRILMMSLRSGAGVDGLQKHCRVAVFGELDWSPQVHEQCIGRLRRDGMTDPALAYFLVADEGSDPSIAQVLQVKRQQGEPIVTPDGKLFATATADLNRTRMLAEATLARKAPPR